MRAASSAPVGAGAAGAAGAAFVDKAGPFGGGSGGPYERRARAIVAGRDGARVGGEPGGVGLAGGEAVEARVVETHGGDAQLGAPEVLAPAAIAVTLPVGA